VAIEHKYYEWLNSGKQKELSRIMVSPERMIDFPTLKQVNIFDLMRQRPVKRGK
jgi:hypothetical protein